MNLVPNPQNCNLHVIDANSAMNLKSLTYQNDRTDDGQYASNDLDSGFKLHWTAWIFLAFLRWAHLAEEGVDNLKHKKSFSFFNNLYEIHYYSHTVIPTGTVTRGPPPLVLFTLKFWLKWWSLTSYLPFWQKHFWTWHDYC